MTIAETLAGKLTFIAGSEKNAGKTTMLNFLLPQLRTRGRTVCFSTGVDGEQFDLVFGNPKPAVFAERGDLVLTSGRALSESLADYRVLEVFPSKTVFGKSVLAEIMRGGFVELHRPGDNETVSQMLDCLPAYGVRTVLGDGAADRLTHSAAGRNSGYVFVLKATRAALETAVRKARMLAKLDAVPLAPERVGGSFFSGGALTAASLTLIPPETGAVILEDFTRVFLTEKMWDDFSARHTVYFKRRIELRFICVICYDVTRAEFLAALNCDAARRYIIFNPYEAAND